MLGDMTDEAKHHAPLKLMSAEVGRIGAARGLDLGAAKCGL